jgi:hypothetical protein
MGVSMSVLCNARRDLIGASDVQVAAAASSLTTLLLLYPKHACMYVHVLARA